MTTRAFSVSSSNGVSVYTVVAEWNGKDLFVACDCKAGLMGDWCRHKSGLLNGDESILITKENLTDLLQWVDASSVRAAIFDIQMAENQQKDAEAFLKKAKVKAQAAKQAAATLINPRVKNELE